MTMLWCGQRGEVDSEFADECDATIGPLPDTFGVNRGYASTASQDILYQKFLHGGPLAAKPGRSAHNYRFAIDLARVEDGKWYWDYDHPAWQRLRDAVDKSAHLHGGWRFPEDTAGRVVADPDHVQDQTKWMAKKAELKASGAW